MHELSLAGGIVSMVEAAAEREHFRRVAQLRLEVGALAGVEPQALRFALTAIVPGTCLEARSRSTRFPVWPRACSAAPA
jgi:hydrogenase nickel incorporation protein HypA/HybF